MRLLAIETATSAQSVALFEEDRLLADISYEANAHKGGLLLPAVDRLLKQAGLAAKDLGAVAVSVGPGSFTGLRVGLATAKGLALGTGAMLVGVPTLEVLAEGYAVPDVTICALLDARRGEVFMALFRRVGTGGAGIGLERVSPDAVLTPEAVQSVLARAESPVHLIGDGAVRYRERFEAMLGDRVCMTETGLRTVPSAAMAGRVGLRQLAGGKRPGAVVEPVYLRKAEAEVNWEKGLLKSPLARVTR
jgi:tRNA threonylcarbamoyladenosine biosynthesis protein TsaB